jgi:nitroreductase
MKEAYLELLRRRHACKAFVPGAGPNDADLDVILEAGRLAPSSFGLEPWRFVVVRDASARARLAEASFGQMQAAQAGCVIALLAQVAELDPAGAYVRAQLAKETPAHEFDAALARYADFHRATDMANWTLAQCFIPATLMLVAAQAAGWDSCPIGGFDAAAVLNVLGADPARERVAMLIALGRCAHAAPPKQRQPLMELVEYL